MSKLKNVTHPTKSLCHKGMAVYNMNFSPSFSSSSVDISWELKKEIINLKHLIKGHIKKKHDETLQKDHFQLTTLHHVWMVKLITISSNTKEKFTTAITFNTFLKRNMSRFLPSSD